MARGSGPGHAHRAAEQSVAVGRVLLCSSDWSLSDLLKANLEHSGFEVLQRAWAGPRADVSELRDAVDVLIADVEDTQEHTGFEAVADLRSRFATQPLLVLAHDWPDARRLQAWQPYRYIRKPFAVDDVLRALEQLMAAVRTPARSQR